MFRALVLGILLLAAPVGAQVFSYSQDEWGKVDLSLTESAVAGAESVLALSEKWEQLTEFSESEPEREWSRAVGRLEILYGNTFGVCTAFLISETEILTNYHCIPGPGTPVRRATLRMGYYTYNAADTESYTVTCHAQDPQPQA